MDKFKGILAKAGWVVALIMAAWLAISDYVEQNPMPVDPQTVEQIAE